jgi:hypothetical protein
MREKLFKNIVGVNIRRQSHMQFVMAYCLMNICMHAHSCQFVGNTLELCTLFVVFFLKKLKIIVVFLSSFQKQTGSLSSS